MMEKLDSAMSEEEARRRMVLDILFSSLFDPEIRNPLICAGPENPINCEYCCFFTGFEDDPCTIWRK